MGDAGGNANGQVADNRRFAAFISYSHADEKAAAKLQRQLERYRLPKHIAEARDHVTSLGTIFRDREDLAAAASLSVAIGAALAQTEALIVICSPDAAASPWVNAEIKLFRETHPDRPILAALLSGDPNLSFPSALTRGGVEPLAADLRPEGDGQQLGFLKIVAGIAGVSLDALIQRDAQRRIRRVTAITVGALAAMLVMAVMTTFAIQSRNEAARQRASAEGLVEYMLTDLRQKLKGVGDINVMDSVNDRAMQHYSSQAALATLPPDSLEQRARILHAMGEDDNNSGKLDAALAKFREAHRATAALLKQDRSNPDRIFAHAQSEYWVGQAAWNKRDRATTRQHWDAYVRLAGDLIAVDPSPSRAHLEMGYALGNLCDLYLYGNFDVAKAAAFCRQSIAHERLALKAAPGNREISTALANRFGWLAESYVAEKKFDAAQAARLEERRIVDGLLSSDPTNFELRFRKTWPELGLAEILVQRGEQRLGAIAYEKVAQDISALDRLAPGNVQVTRSLAKAWFYKAKALASLEPQSAQIAFGKSKKVIDDYERKHGEQDILNGFDQGFNELERVFGSGKIALVIGDRREMPRSISGEFLQNVA
jgi:MTH538 TIR-like domain (DUF1863)